MAVTKIEWAHFTHNPWIGCTKLSPACDFCYAEAQNNHRKWAVGWGPHAPRKRTKTRSNLAKWDRASADQGVRKRVFVASLADVADNHRSIEPEWRRQLVDDIRQCRNLDFLLLTKRPQNMAKLYPDMMEEWPDNAWMGVSTENREEMFRRGEILATLPAKITFWSAEPLLGNLGRIPPEIMPSWIIAGGESGGNARPTKPDWFRSLRDQCAAADVPFFFKQWGEWVSVSEVAGPGAHFKFDDGATVRRVGKSRSGRTLDGVVHDGYPVPRWIST